jgi:hypothetical protein
MARVIENMTDLTSMLSSSCAIAIVSVPWSPWHSKSREVLAALESTCRQWSPNASVKFFDLWPERDEELNRWYTALCTNLSPRLELHGHGYGPLWWLAEGEVLECLIKPYEYSLETIQQRSAELFKSYSSPA